MADSVVTITPGVGASIDTRTETTNGRHRQVVVIGDPSTNDGVAPVSATTGLAVSVPGTSSASITTLASSTSSAQLLAANSSRRGLYLTNTDANGVYVKFGATASATDFTVFIPGGTSETGFGYYEMPDPVYTGRIDAIWAGNGSGSLVATELT